MTHRSDTTVGTGGDSESHSHRALDISARMALHTPRETEAPQLGEVQAPGPPSRTRTTGHPYADSLIPVWSSPSRIDSPATPPHRPAPCPGCPAAQPWLCPSPSDPALTRPLPPHLDSIPLSSPSPMLLATPMPHPATPPLWPRLHTPIPAPPLASPEAPYPRPAPSSPSQPRAPQKASWNFLDSFSMTL